MDPSDWIALCAVLCGLLTSLAAIWANSRITRSAAAQQAELLDRQHDLESRRTSEERLWTARAEVYANYLGWLRGELRETLRFRLEGVVEGSIPASWWKTPYELGNRMRLFESAAVQSRRAALVRELAAIGQVISLLRGAPAKRHDILRRVQVAADEAIRLIDDLADAIRSDMQVEAAARPGGEVDFVEDLADHDSIAAGRSKSAAKELLEALRATDG